MRRVPILILMATAILMLATASARATFLYDWTGKPSASIDDPAGDNSGTPASDILKLWYAQEAGNSYFRLDLSAKPDVNAGSGLYGVWLDDAPGGGVNNDTHYIPINLSSINELVVSHFSPGSGNFEAEHLHHVLAPTPGVDTTDLATLGGFFNTDNGGTSLEWTIPADKLSVSGPFTIYGGAHNLATNVTDDTTAPLQASVIPEPSTVVMLTAAAALGLVLLARRRK